MEPFSALLALCVWGEPLVTGEISSQKPVTRNIDVFFDVCLNKRLSKQSRCRLFETPYCSLWRHCNDNSIRSSTRYTEIMKQQPQEQLTGFYFEILQNQLYTYMFLWQTSLDQLKGFVTINEWQNNTVRCLYATDYFLLITHERHT